MPIIFACRADLPASDAANRRIGSIRGHLLRNSTNIGQAIAPIFSGRLRGVGRNRWWAMKQLFLLRHAKAQPSSGEPDHERELDARGIADADAVGRSLAAQGWRPDAALVSYARRTRQTFDHVQPFLDPAPRLRIEPALYDAAPGAILALLRDTPAEAASLLVVGHNPGIGEVARRLAAKGPSAELAALRGSFPTSALAVIRFDIAAWPEIGPGIGRLVAYLWPGAPHRGR
jgi:phosphohistidine phosphatase